MYLYANLEDPQYNYRVQTPLTSTEMTRDWAVLLNNHHTVTITDALGCKRQVLLLRIRVEQLKKKLSGCL